MVIRLYKTGYKYSEEGQVSSMFFRAGYQANKEWKLWKQ